METRRVDISLCLCVREGNSHINLDCNSEISGRDKNSGKGEQQD